MSGDSGGLGGDFAVEIDLDVFRRVARGQQGLELFEEGGRQIDIVSHAGGFVVEVGVRTEIRTVAGGAAFEIYGAHKVGVHEGLEAVVNGRERDGGFRLFDAGKDFVGGGVIPLGDQGIINQLTLWGGPVAAASELFGDGRGGCLGCNHRGRDTGKSPRLIRK